MLGAGGVRGDERQVDVRGERGGELYLRLLRGVHKTLFGDTVVAQIDAVVALEVLRDIVHEPLIEVVAAEAVVAVGGKHFEYAVADIEQGYIEGTAAEVVNEDLLPVLLIHAVGKGSGSRLVDDALYVKTGDTAGVLCRLTLRVGEVSGNGDDRFGDLLAEVGLRVLLELLKYHSGDLLRGVSLTLDRALEIGAHLTFDGRNGVVGVGDGLTLCDLTYHTLAVFECNDGRSGVGALRVGDDLGLTALKYCYA